MKYSDFMRGGHDLYRNTASNIARHEAGHAVVAMMTDYMPINKVQIWRGSGRQWSGTVKFDTSSLAETRAKNETAFYQKAVMVSIAGTLAVVPSLRGEELADSLGFPDSAVFATGMCKLADEATEDAVLDDLTTRATCILEQQEDALGRLARRLVRRRTMNTYEITEIVEATTCRPTFTMN
jgi:ATP-dependent Zn protease